LIRQTLLKELAEVASGNAAPQDASAFSKAGYPFVRAGSLVKLLDGVPETDLEKIKPEVAKLHRLRLFPSGTVLFAKSGMSATKGHVYALRCPCYVVSHLATLVPHDSRDSAFLVRALEQFSPTRLIKDQAYPSIRLVDIEEMPVAAPTRQEERWRIAQILDQADALKHKRRTTLDQIAALQRSYFFELFGDATTNSKRWPIVEFSEACQNEDGARIPVRASDRADRVGQYPYYGASGIIDYVDDYIFEGERLLIGEDGANLIARSSPVAFIASGNYWVNNHAHVLAANGKAELRYLEFFINGIDLRPFVSGSAQPKLNQSNMNRIPVPIPPMDMQKEFVEFLRTSDRLSALMNRNLTYISSLFDLLQHKAFFGEQ
jgi:type I restriction enzyme S subunit